MEIRNLKAVCLDKSSDADVVLHEVNYEYKDSGVWVAKSVAVMATDPQDAIEYIRRRGE